MASSLSSAMARCVQWSRTLALWTAAASCTMVVAADYQRARHDPVHFQPLIEHTPDAQCLACHAEVLKPSVRAVSPAGAKASEAMAWYQQNTAYRGEQDTFHRRHMVTPLAQQLMDLRCSTCHQGHDPRDETPMSSATSARDAGYRLRKTVTPETTCLKCHGQMNIQVMGLPSPWHESKGMFGNSCLTCHAAIRTTRHQVTYLKAEAIEAAGAKNADTCFGCHGGRSWYRIAYPYPRHAWDGMAPEVPDWAKDRPTESEARFRMTAAVNPK